MNDELELNADEHIPFMTYVINLCWNGWENVTRLIGGSATTRRPIAT